MVWFRVDDGFPTSRKVLQIPKRRRAAAIGVWTLAGAWAARELTDGYLPRYALDEIPDGSRYAPDLVTAGLWHYLDASPMAGRPVADASPTAARCFADGCPMDPRQVADGGWSFHDWPEYQPSKADVLKEREAHAARQKAYRDRRAAERDKARDASRDASRDAPVTVPSVTVPRPDPTRPDPTVVPTELPSGGTRAERATRISDSFAINNGMRSWAAENVPGMDIDFTTKKFVLHFQAQSGQRGTMINWEAAWKKWMLSDYKPNVPTNVQNIRGYGRPGERKSLV